MTPKEKAKELFNKFYQEAPYQEIEFYSNDVMARQCALKAVDLHLEELSKMKLIFSDRELHYKYWQEVKQEILNL